MIGKEKDVGLLFCVAICIVTCSSCSRGPSPVPPTDIPSSQAESLDEGGAKIFRWKSKCDSETKRLVRLGRRRIAIDVTAYKPPSSGTSTFVVHLVLANGKGRQEIGRFGLHPDAPFRSSDTVSPHRFQFSMSEYAELLETDEIQIEVSIDTVEKREHNGVAELSIYWFDLDN